MSYEKSFAVVFSSLNATQIKLANLYSCVKFFLMNKGSNSLNNWEKRTILRGLMIAKMKCDKVTTHFSIVHVHVSTSTAYLRASEALTRGSDWLGFLGDDVGLTV